LLQKEAGQRPTELPGNFPSQAPKRSHEPGLETPGFSFVGPTICYAMMQAIGMVDDHLQGCFRANENDPLKNMGLPLRAWPPPRRFVLPCIHGSS